MSKESALAVATSSPGLAPAPETPAIAPAQTQPDSAGTPSAAERFAHLAKKESELVKQKQAMAAEREKIELARQKLAKFEEDKKTNPVQALKDLGFSETDIFNYMAEGQKPEPTPQELAQQIAEKTVEARLKAYQDEQEQKQKAIEAQTNKQLVQNFRGELGKVMEADKAKYKHANFHGLPAQELAYELVAQIVKDSNGEDIISAREAMDMVEQHYRDQYAEAKAALEEQAAAEVTPERSRTVTPADPTNQPKPAVSKTRTLTNDVSPSLNSLNRRIETREQKRERLMNALRTGKL